METNDQRTAHADERVSARLLARTLATVNADQRQLTARLRDPGDYEVWVAVRTALLDHGLHPDGVVVAEMTDGGPETFDGVEMETYDGVVVSTQDHRVYRIQIGHGPRQPDSWVTCRWCDMTAQWREQSGFHQQIEAALAALAQRQSRQAP